VAIGRETGQLNQGGSAVAIGLFTGQSNQGEQSVSIGRRAGQDKQASGAVAIGSQAGQTNQGTNAVVIGAQAASSSQGENAVAIGYKAGQNNQRSGAIAIGLQAGENTQGVYAIAIGEQAGMREQRSGAIAIGYQAGNTNQGTCSIAIGFQAGITNQAANSIVLNATGAALNATNSGFYVRPIRNDNLTTALVYNTTTYEISYATTGTKTFVIEHPLDKEKYLVHGCLEGPEGGVYYRGKAEITNDNSVVVKLPEYVSNLAKDLSVQITPIYNGKIKVYNVSNVEDNCFTVYGENGEFFWIAYGNRTSIEVEPYKKDINVKGYGPYRWI